MNRSTNGNDARLVLKRKVCRWPNLLYMFCLHSFFLLLYFYILLFSTFLWTDFQSPANIVWGYYHITIRQVQKKKTISKMRYWLMNCLIFIVIEWLLNVTSRAPVRLCSASGVVFLYEFERILLFNLTAAKVNVLLLMIQHWCVRYR